jgi:RNA methyltransferase, TrmH family
MLGKNEIKSVRELHTSKGRSNAGLFIAEGTKITCEIINAQPGLIDTIYATRNYVTQLYSDLPVQGLKIIEVKESELERLSMQKTPNQVVTVCRMLPASNPTAPLPFTFYLDDIRDPGNFGTIIRLCAWFGIPRLYCSEQCCELYNPKVIQSTMGAFLRVEVIYKPLRDIVNNSDKPIVYGASAEGSNIFDMKLGNGTVIIGNEAHGISEECLQFVTEKISIPHPSGNPTESLNAAMAASIICAEFYRQRKV